MPTLFRKSLEIGLLVLVVVNIVGMVILAIANHSVGLHPAGTRFPTLTGYSMEGVLWSKRAQCYLIRVSSDGCEYCRQDAGYYRSLNLRARATGCESILIGAQFGALKSSTDFDGATVLQFVDMSFGRVLNPYLTPQTLLLDNKGVVVWSRDGAMDGTAVESGLRAMGGFR
jgi:hypothetical protein